jgi:hypothetical protein
VVLPAPNIGDNGVVAKEIPYREESTDELARKAGQTWTYRFDPDGSPDRVVLAGVCPACNHIVDYPYPLALVRSNVALDTTESSTIQIPVFCRCKITHPHANGEAGCGRGWNLEVPKP